MSEPTAVENWSGGKLGGGGWRKQLRNDCSVLDIIWHQEESPGGGGGGRALCPSCPRIVARGDGSIAVRRRFSRTL